MSSTSTACPQTELHVVVASHCDDGMRSTVTSKCPEYALVAPATRRGTIVAFGVRLATTWPAIVCHHSGHSTAARVTYAGLTIDVRSSQVLAQLHALVEEVARNPNGRFRDFFVKGVVNRAIADAPTPLIDFPCTATVLARLRKQTTIVSLSEATKELVARAGASTTSFAVLHRFGYEHLVTRGLDQLASVRTRSDGRSVEPEDISVRVARRATMDADNVLAMDDASPGVRRKEKNPRVEKVISYVNRRYSRAADARTADPSQGGRITQKVIFVPSKKIGKGSDIAHSALHSIK